MYLNQILKSVEKKYSKINFKNISFDSRKIKKNDVFFAFNGHKVSGIKFINKAIKNGAVAIILENKKKIITKKKIPLIYVKNSRLVFSEACSNLYKQKPKNIIAVTGTNGKTSVVNFFYQILSLNKILSASIGTLGINSKKIKKKTGLTSMDSLFLNKYLNILKKNNINNVAIEASSHGLHQNRLDFIKFKTAIFTNLSHDHLDYHKTIKHYKNSKMYLFNKILPKNSYIITDIENKEFKELKRISIIKKFKLKTIGYKRSDLRILDHKYHKEGQMLKVHYKSKIYSISIPLIGYLQCKNLLMSILAARFSGIEMKKIVNVIKRIKPIEGRLEMIGLQKNNSKVILDFAHTPQALENALKTLKEHFKKDVSIVFGCGGERDYKKRSIMGNIAKKYCKKIYITDDNPRKENPKKIRKMIIGKDNTRFKEIASREKAIFSAVEDLEQEEILIVAGKGHEKFQDYGKKKIIFSDKKIIKKAIIKNKKNSNNYNWKSNILSKSLNSEKLKKLNINEISIDSKNIKKNSLFIAIKGKKNDGHNYANEALIKGANKIIVSRNLEFIKKNKQIKVSNTFDALNKIAKNTRKFSNAKIVGITGSTGKTTLKNLLNFLLLRYGKVHSSPKSYNNKFGVPISISNLNENSEFGIFEIGMSKPGEIKNLSKLILPHIGIITNISQAHLENFKNLKGIAKAKSEILENIIEDGYIILNRDDNFFRYLFNKAKLKKLNIISFSTKRKADIYLKSLIKINNYYKLIINIKGKDFDFYSKYNFNNLIQNIVSAISVLFLMNLDLIKIKKSFLNFKITEGRGDISNISIYGKKIQLIDDSYNANPLSMKSSIHNFDKIIKKNGKKILILGDMLELGKDSKKYHKLISTDVNNTDINKVYVYGNHIKETYKNLNLKKKGGIFTRLENLKKIFKNNINNNDIVMIKGSNATKLFKITQNLKKGNLNAI